MKYAIIYLHGFNSASLDLSGNLLVSKQKLAVLERYCKEHEIRFYTPNVDYRDFNKIVNDLYQSYTEFVDDGYQVLFMGSSMGGFTSEYMALKTHSKAIMINPVVSPIKLLPQFIGVNENFETLQPYDWQLKHCEQYQSYENQLRNTQQSTNKTILLDMGDELLDPNETQKTFQQSAKIVSYSGGSHSFEHIEQALAEIEAVIFN